MHIVSIVEICKYCFNKLVNQNGVEHLSDSELDELIFAAQNERIERAINRGEYKPEEE